MKLLAPPVPTDWKAGPITEVTVLGRVAPMKYEDARQKQRSVHVICFYTRRTSRMAQLVSLHNSGVYVQ